MKGIIWKSNGNLIINQRGQLYPKEQVVHAKSYPYNHQNTTEDYLDQMAIHITTKI